MIKLHFCKTRANRVPVEVLANWTIDADPARTRAAYLRWRQEGTYCCDCAYCRNFEAARSHIYSSELLRSLAKLGVAPPLKETEVYELGEVEPERRLYGGWFPVVGQLLAGPEGHSPRNLDEEPIRNTLEIISVSAGGVMLPEAFRAEPVVDINFLAVVPWVLEELA